MIILIAFQRIPIVLMFYRRLNAALFGRFHKNHLISGM
tara:strand:- start:3523 stop:3636 length:114 start_codon:yes stop_codon:yes gene_type:complete